MSRNAWIIFCIVVVGILGGLVYISNKNKLDVSNIDAGKIQPASEYNGQIADNVFGNRKSKVVLIEYGDYQCPGCASAFSVLDEVSNKYKNEMAFVFRNFPLTTIHPNARAASAAAEAAGLDGKFWEMHSQLYEDQNAWKDTSGQERTDMFAGYAKTIGISEDKFRDNLANPAINKKISFDQALGKKIGVTGTPGLYLNGKRLDKLRIKDGSLIESEDQSLPLVWTEAEDLERLVIIPALKEAGIKLPEDK